MLLLVLLENVAKSWRVISQAHPVQALLDQRGFSFVQIALDTVPQTAWKKRTTENQLHAAASSPVKAPSDTDTALVCILIRTAYGRHAATRSGPDVVTIERLGQARIPYRLHNQTEFEAELTALGYDIRMPGTYRALQTSSQPIPGLAPILVDAISLLLHRGIGTICGKCYLH